MTTKSGKSINLQAVTKIYSATGWIEIYTVPSAEADFVANQVELAWLTRFPPPSKIIMDRGNEILAVFREMIIINVIIEKPVTSSDPQANAILEKVHETVGDILHTFKVQSMVLDDENPWDAILASTMLALRATLYTSTKYSSAQLMFGRDTIINQRHCVDWERNRKREQVLINKGNEHENRNQINHIYKQGRKLLLKNAWKTKFNQDDYLGPYYHRQV